MRRHKNSYNFLNFTDIEIKSGVIVAESDPQHTLEGQLLACRRYVSFQECRFSPRTNSPVGGQPTIKSWSLGWWVSTRQRYTQNITNVLTNVLWAAEQKHWHKQPRLITKQPRPNESELPQRVRGGQRTFELAQVVTLKSNNLLRTTKQLKVGAASLTAENKSEPKEEILEIKREITD